MREVELNDIRVNDTASPKRIEAAVPELDKTLDSLWTYRAKDDYRCTENRLPSKEEILASKANEAKTFKKNLGVSPEDPRSPAQVLADAVFNPETYVFNLVKTKEATRNFTMERNLDMLTKLAMSRMDKEQFPEEQKE